MSISIGQTTYNNAPTVAVPGMLADDEVNQIDSFVASETIYPGRLLELSSDGLRCQQVQDTGNTVPTQILGIAVLQTSREGTGAVGVASQGGAVYNAGDAVPVLRKGRCYAEWKGTTQTAFGMPNVYHSSTVTTDRGKLTDASTSATAGSEVSNAGNSIKLRKALAGSGNVALVDVNLPGAS